MFLHSKTEHHCQTSQSCDVKLPELMLHFRGCLHPVRSCQLPVILPGKWSQTCSLACEMQSDHVASICFPWQNQNIQAQHHIELFSDSVSHVAGCTLHTTAVLTWSLRVPKGCAHMTRRSEAVLSRPTQKLNIYSFHVYLPPFSIALNTLNAAADLSKNVAPFTLTPGMRFLVVNVMLRQFLLVEGHIRCGALSALA